MPLLKISKFAGLVAVALFLAACYGCFDEVGIERDLFEERDMYPYDFDGQPAIDGPEYLLFVDLATGEYQEKVATVENIGRTVLFIDDFLVDGPFDLEVPSSFDGAEQRLKPGETLDLRVGYTALDEEPRQGMLTVLSNDPEQPEFPIELWANVEVPCMEVSPSSILNFGEVEQGESATRRIYVTNCASNADLVAEIADFFDDQGFELVGSAEEESALVIAPGTTKTLAVQFSPQQIRRYEGEITLESQGIFGEETTVSLRGDGVAPPCPQAVINGFSDQQTSTANPTATLQGIPLEIVHFSAEDSFAADGGPIEAYEWTLVETPSDTLVELGLPADGPINELYLELSGTYVVELHVWDQQGTRSCEPARMTVEAVSNDAIHLQLVWDTPTDPNPFNNSGTDLDLHFLHQNGSWNSAPWDCHWLNMNPVWGDANNDDMNPRLDIDKVDGWGPENINLLIPEDGVRYSVGVHYFSDHGYGPSYATVRIFLNGELEFELADRHIEDREFWHVADIDWPSQAITVRDQITDGFPP